uniref:ELMO domain-containing protein n=1 Tax=Oryza punctata TaxID=4537 RepID=A0A0E0KTG3_ORYPU
MDRNAGSFVAIRRLSGGSSCHDPSPNTYAEVVAGSTAWIGRGFSCVCAQRRDSDQRISFDLSPAQECCLQRLQNRIEVPYDGSNGEHQELLCKQNGDRALWEYPFAVAGVNITFMLIQMLDLQAENDRAFDILYCITFKLMDHKWLEMHANYMDFNAVIKSTRRQLERELLLEDIQRIEDMPSYRFLDR